jgi:archaellum component FlaC
MDKDVDEVKKTAHYLKTKVEELDKEVKSLLKNLLVLYSILTFLVLIPWYHPLLRYVS